LERLKKNLAHAEAESESTKSVLRDKEKALGLFLREL
jgi:hypothetical protein